jgi:hypothetical protein
VNRHAHLRGTVIFPCYNFLYLHLNRLRRQPYERRRGLACGRRGPYPTVLGRPHIRSPLVGQLLTVVLAASVSVRLVLPRSWTVTPAPSVSTGAGSLISFVVTAGKQPVDTAPPSRRWAGLAGQVDRAEQKEPDRSLTHLVGSGAIRARTALARAYKWIAHQADASPTVMQSRVHALGSFLAHSRIP